MTPDLTSVDKASGLKLNVAIAYIVALCYLFTTYRMHENLQTAGVIIAFVGMLLLIQSRITWIPWAALCLIFLIGILQRPIDVPNHHYMLTYTSAALAISLSAAVDKRELYLTRNAQMLIVALMAIATVQRLVQPKFLDGSYLAYEITRGGFAGPLLRLMSGTQEIIRQNNELILQFREIYPLEMVSVTLQPPVPHIDLLALIFMVIILAIEIWVCAWMFFKPRGIITHASVIFFAVTLSFLRQEFTFISVLCTLGLMVCPQEHKSLRITYAIAAILCASAVLKTLNA